MNVESKIQKPLGVLCSATAGVRSISQCMGPAHVDYEGLGAALLSLCSDLDQAQDELELAIRELENSNEPE